MLHITNDFNVQEYNFEHVAINRLLRRGNSLEEFFKLFNDSSTKISNLFHLQWMKHCMDKNIYHKSV